MSKKPKISQKKYSPSFRNLSKGEKIAYFILKTLSLGVFIYSGIFWGLIAVINKFWADDTEIAYKLLCGILLTLIGIALMFFKFNIIQAFFTISGVAVYCSAVSQMLEFQVEPVKTNVGYRHYIIFAAAVISALILIIHIWKIICSRLEIREAKRNAPAESILDD